ncbi:MAG: hypothetical protein ACT4OO_12010 [Nitrospiraceae bacterium]
MGVVGPRLPSMVSSLALGMCVACSTPEFTTTTIYESPQAFVRLELDRTLKSGEGHSHPIQVTADQMAAVLAGVRVDEPVAKIPVLDEISKQRYHPAFNESDIQVFAPLLAHALGMATPEEVITFYRTRDLSAIRREVTSGGLFVQGEQLHFILSNYRSPTHFIADIGVAETTDDRMTPMKPLAPQKGRLGFEPQEAHVSSVPAGVRRVFYWDQREIIILFRKLTPRPLFPSPAPPAN